MNSLVQKNGAAPHGMALRWLLGMALRGRCLAALVCLGAWGLCLPAGAQTPRAAPAVDAAALAQQPLSLTPYLAVLEDPGQQLTLADVQRADLAARFLTNQRPAEALNFGITPSAYWLRLALRNTGAQPVPVMLEVGYPRLSHIAFYRPDAQGAYQVLNTGITLPFASRTYPSRFFVFPLTLPARAEQVFYLRIASTTAFIVPARLWTPQAFAAHERNDHLSQAWYFGMVTAMVLFNLLLFIGLRERIYLLYVFSCTSVAFALAAQNGLVKAYLWPDTPLWSDLSTTVGYSLTLTSALLFLRDMLDTPRLIPKFDRGLQVLAGFFLVSPVVFFYSGQTFIKAAAYLYMAAIVLALAIGLWGVYRRQRSAYFYVGAYGMLCLGAVTNALRSVGLLPTNLFTTNALQVGSALEMVLLAFALADRFNAIRQEKARIQGALLQAQETLIDNLKSSERLLEARVAERTEALQQLNQQLEVLSSTDALTGLANRRRFDDTLEREWQRAIRDGRPLALALLDVDWFKKYNDQLGHPAGDACLRRVAQVLASQVCRSGDLVARFGGEEFVFLAPATSGADALNLAQRICDALQALALPHPGSELGCVTLSVGVAAELPTQGSTPDGLLKRADDALYRAKAQGRNRALLAPVDTA